MRRLTPRDYLLCIIPALVTVLMVDAISYKEVVGIIAISLLGILRDLYPPSL